MRIFRKMIEQDVESIAKLEQDIFADAWTAQGIYETFCQQQAFVTVAEEDGQVVGYCILYYVMDEGEIARIAVDKKMRRQGLGNGLLNYTFACCREKQISRILLDVRETNESARRFYQTHGFEEDGIRKNFYEQPKENAVLMSRDLV